jgi:quinol monooxygenase YgiN
MALNRRALLMGSVLSGLAGRAAAAQAPQGPVTILFSITVKEGKEQEVADMMQRLTSSTRAEDDGVLSYLFLQQQNSARDYVLYEQWRDSAALNAHLKRLQKVFGPPREGGAIPAAILDLFETSRAVRYRVVT